MNNLNRKFCKPRAGLLLLASPRFRNLGEGLNRGTYNERKEKDVNKLLGSLQGDLDIVFPGIVYSREDVQKTIDVFISEKVDFVVAQYLSWAEDFAWIRFLRDMPEIPILFINTVKDRVSFDNTLEEDDFIDFLCAGTLVGSLEAAGSVSRLPRKNIKIIMGNHEQVVGQILCFAKAARVRSVLREATFGLLASYNEVMWSTYMDPYNFFTKIGPELRFISYSTLADEIAGLPAGEVLGYKEELQSKYKVMDDVDDNQFLESVKASLALAHIAEKMNIDTMVFNDIDQAMFKLIGLRPGFYHPSFNTNMSVLVPEADMGAGLITFILKMLSGKHVSFIEPFHIESAENTFAAGHAGPNDHNEPGFDGNVIIARDVRFAKTNYKYAGAPFAWYRIPKGRKTMAQLAEENGKYKLVCTLVDSLEGDHLYVSYSHSIFRPLVPVEELFLKTLKIGTTQHFAVVDGDYTAGLSMFAEMMGFDFYKI